MNLAATLQSFVEDAEVFNRKLSAKADDLAMGAAGGTLLSVIEYVEKMLGFKHSVGADHHRSGC